MNPQVLIDGVAHGVRSAILLLDKRRKAAIASCSGRSMAPTSEPPTPWRSAASG